MINHYYQQQLQHLKELGAEFSRKHPALAPMLAGQSADPDVERLLEGVAFLSGTIQQKLDDDFPELIHGLTQLLFPHYLRPLPASTIVQFRPKPGLKKPLTVKSGVELASKERNGVSCTFTTCGDVEILPLSLVDVETRENTIKFYFELRGMTLGKLNNDSLRLFLKNDYAEASDYLYVFRRSIEEIRLHAGGKKIVLSPEEALSVFPDEIMPNLFPFKGKSIKALQVIQEYFTLPHKLLFIEFRGLKWLKNFDAGSDFEIELVFSKNNFDLKPSLKDFALFCVPAVNIFSQQADSVFIDHKAFEYKIVPAGGDDNQVYSVEKVVGFEHGTSNEREYQSFEMFNPQSKHIPLYSLRRKKSVLSKGTNLFLSVAYPKTEERIMRESLALQVLCTNGSNADCLQYGDICKPTNSSPVLADFTNITTPTSAVDCPLDNNLLWRFLSHIYINQASLANKENLSGLLKLYIFTDSQDSSKVLANTKRVESIDNLLVKTVNRLHRGQVIRGNDIHISFDRDGFVSNGDMYLFGSVINKLFSAYSGINSFTQMTMSNPRDIDRFQWPAQLENKCSV